MCVCDLQYVLVSYEEVVGVGRGRLRAQQRQQELAHRRDLRLPTRGQGD